VVKQADDRNFTGNRLGRRHTAKLSVSALMSTYVLTGPDSARCSAGLYLVGLINTPLALRACRLASPRQNFFAMLFGDRGHALFLGGKTHQGRTGIKRHRRSRLYDPTNRHGCDCDRLEFILNAAAHARFSVALPLAPLLRSGGVGGGWATHKGVVKTVGRAGNRGWRSRHYAPGDERRGVARPGVSRARSSQAEELKSAPALWIFLYCM
jgi:hypothetical protein